MLVGAYWSQREESAESAAERITALLTALSEQGATLSSWYRKGQSRAAALRVRLTIDPATVARELRRNHTDMPPRRPIPELGFGFSAWNGSDTSLSVHIGSYCRGVGNAVVLKVGTCDELSDASYRAILEHVVRVFDPDDAVVGVSRSKPWLSYRRGGAFSVDSRAPRSCR